MKCHMDKDQMGIFDQWNCPPPSPPIWELLKISNSYSKTYTNYFFISKMLLIGLMSKTFFSISQTIMDRIFGITLNLHYFSSQTPFPTYNVVICSQLSRVQEVGMLKHNIVDGGGGFFFIWFKFQYISSMIVCTKKFVGMPSNLKFRHIMSWDCVRILKLIYFKLVGSDWGHRGWE